MSLTYIKNRRESSTLLWGTSERDSFRTPTSIAQVLLPEICWLCRTKTNLMQYPLHHNSVFL